MASAKELFLWCLVLVCVSGITEAVTKAPVVQVYSRHPVEPGKENIFNCYVKGFYPPKINVTLLKNGKAMPDVMKTDLSFEEDWTFQLLSYVPVIPDRKDQYECRVEHSALPTPKIIRWDQHY
ncbi:beta-2-microglobulin-like [Ailuropoda melanoleuca]|uniref:beta-2-microglobulin-like n=1 Tax=Ailuropoda melanoleuca TaxID=9646 RepID=UPI001494BB9B|nr:beta-2-microglobulin-like [Ailuropoda melanoleuca]XP_034506089.1 beta-2-microglobulin-like [Ailuropoda melanoleuca]